MDVNVGLMLTGWRDLNSSFLLVLTFKWNGLQDAELLEDRHEKYDNHSDGEQLHALDAHDVRAKGARSGPSLDTKPWQTKARTSPSHTEPCPSTGELGSFRNHSGQVCCPEHSKRTSESGRWLLYSQHLRKPGKRLETDINEKRSANPRRNRSSATKTLICAQ